jgi:hypothetical protein
VEVSHMLVCMSAVCYGLLFIPGAAPLPPPRVDEASRTFLQEVVKEVGVPPTKPFGEKADSAAELPSFTAKVMAGYPRTDNPSRLRMGVRKARVLLWALAPGQQVPADLDEEVKAARADLKDNLAILRDGYRAPVNENQFKNAILRDERKLAALLGRLDDELDELKAAGKDQDKETPRWQANYNLTLAALELQIAFIYEYQSMLGSLRQELPPRDPALHGGWKLVAQPRLHGDLIGKKMASEAYKLLDKIGKDHPGTPWELLAKRARLVPLGLEWEPIP